VNEQLITLGVPPELQAFFNLHELYFDYDDTFEYFDFGFHLVPTNSGIWLAGRPLTTDLIITSSAMEAIAFLT